jgi:hypothetical protein
MWFTGSMVQAKGEELWPTSSVCDGTSQLVYGRISAGGSGVASQNQWTLPVSNVPLKSEEEQMVPFRVIMIAIDPSSLRGRGIGKLQRPSRVRYSTGPGDVLHSASVTPRVSSNYAHASWYAF